jgi:hypothetical protein
MTHLKPLFILIASLLALLPVASYAQREDAALWMSMSADKNINKKTAWHLTTQTRINDNFRRYDYSYIDFGIDRKLSKRWNGQIAYVLNAKNDLAYGMLFRHQFYANATYGKNFGDFKISDRHQVQTQIEDLNFEETGGFPDLFYRNKLSVKWRGPENFTPYLSSEVYFRINHPRAHENTLYRIRYFAGVEWEISKRKSLDIYYLHQRQSTRTGIAIIHVIGLRYNFSFKNKKENNEPKMDNSGSGE